MAHFNLFFFSLNLLGALSLIQSCLKPDPNTRATTKDILRHDWLVHGPVLSVPSHSTSTAATTTTTTTSSSNDYEPVRLRTITPVDNSSSANNSLAELELHSSSFFDSNRLREHSAGTKEQQRRNRASAIPISVRYLSANSVKSNSSSLTARPSYRRPVSLSIDDQHSSRQSQRTISPATIDRFSFTLSPESTPAPFPISSDYDLPSKSTAVSIAPSVFTTSAIKFAPAPPLRHYSLYQDPENASARLENNSDNSTNTASVCTNHSNRHSLLTSLELPATYINRLLDDNNNFVSLKVSE